MAKKIRRKTLNVALFNASTQKKYFGAPMDEVGFRKHMKSLKNKKDVVWRKKKLSFLFTFGVENPFKVHYKKSSREYTRGDILKKIYRTLQTDKVKKAFEFPLKKIRVNSLYYEDRIKDLMLDIDVC
jgi:hypothetical protein